jgi:hypothetical protein
MNARDVLAAQVSEDQLLRAVLEHAAWLGLLVHHCRPARTAKGWRTPIQGTRGFPDLAIAGPGGLLLPETKSTTGSLDPDQRRWRDVLLASGQPWRLWRPQQWLSGQIRAELEALAKGEARV